MRKIEEHRANPTENSEGKKKRGNQDKNSNLQTIRVLRKQRKMGRKELPENY